MSVLEIVPNIVTGTLGNMNGLEVISKLYDLYGPIVKLDAVVGRTVMILLYDAESASQVSKI